MKKVAAIFADGCEEIKGLSQVDVLRRLGVLTDMIGLTKLQVHGDHGINTTCDEIPGDSLLDYDLVSFPGDKPGAEALRDSSRLIQLMKKRHQLGKWNAAMCTTPIALSRYGLLDDTDYTCYPGFEKEIGKEYPIGKFHEDIVVTDSKQKAITSHGPATVWVFSYALAQALDIKTKTLEDGMFYTYLRDNI